MPTPWIDEHYVGKSYRYEDAEERTIRNADTTEAWGILKKGEAFEVIELLPENIKIGKRFKCNKGGYIFTFACWFLGESIRDGSIVILGDTVESKEDHTGMVFNEYTKRWSWL